MYRVICSHKEGDVKRFFNINETEENFNFSIENCFDVDKKANFLSGAIYAKGFLKEGFSFGKKVEFELIAFPIKNGIEVKEPQLKWEENRILSFKS